MGFYGSEDPYLPVLLLHPEESIGTEGFEEEINKTEKINTAQTEKF